MSLFDNTESIRSTPNSTPGDEKLEFISICESSKINHENFLEDDESTTTLTIRHQKRRGRKPKYPDPTPGYRSSYSVNRSFTQTEVMLLKNILKESGEPPADLFATRVWPPSTESNDQQHNSHNHHRYHDNEHDEHDMEIKIMDQVNDATMVFPVNEENPKNQELLSNARRKRSRNVTSPYQSRVLRKVLAVTSFPSTEMREALASSLNMHPRTVQIWFQNQRQKAKNNLQTPTVNTNTNANTSKTTTSSMNSEGEEITPIDDYSPEMMPMPTTDMNAIYFPNTNLTFQNNNVAAHEATNSQAILTPPISEDSRQPFISNGNNNDIREDSNNHNCSISKNDTPSPHAHPQLTAQSFLPDATTTYVSTAQFANPYILPIFSPNTPLPSPPTQTYIQDTFHHPQYFRPSSSSSSNTTSTFKFQNYPTHQISSQQHQDEVQQHQSHNLYDYNDPNVANPTLDILAAAATAALQADISSHHPIHHQIQSIHANTNERIFDSYDY
ncbi:852_t:CDS:1 [Ambispora leptoticha]|uniref:852_t:CDS:1 n=1 Tax=Ambispora leptoticha TaxID=144679 RepID=A0A9N9G0Y8_9GLOM|nr:852_t:CDS:1 [Ambispora leptoticha]